MTPDLKQLRDLVREMRDAFQKIAQGPSAHGVPIETEEAHYLGLGLENAIGIAHNMIVRADAIIGPGDGFPEVKQLNEGDE